MPGKNTAKLSHTGNTPGWHNVVNSMKAFIDLREKKAVCLLFTTSRYNLNITFLKGYAVSLTFSLGNCIPSHVFLIPLVVSFNFFFPCSTSSPGYLICFWWNIWLLFLCWQFLNHLLPFRLCPCVSDSFMWLVNTPTCIPCRYFKVTLTW